MFEVLSYCSGLVDLLSHSFFEITLVLNSDSEVVEAHYLVNDGGVENGPCVFGAQQSQSLSRAVLSICFYDFVHYDIEQQWT